MGRAETQTYEEWVMEDAETTSISGTVIDSVEVAEEPDARDLHWGITGMWRWEVRPSTLVHRSQISEGEVNLPSHASAVQKHPGISVQFPKRFYRENSLTRTKPLPQLLYCLVLRISKQRSITAGSVYASNVAPASLNRMASAATWCSYTSA